MCKTSQKPGGSVSCAFASPTRTSGMASASFFSNSGSIDPKILVIITRLRMPESLPAFWLPLQRFQESCYRRQARLAAIRERRGRADLAALQNRPESLRHAPPAPSLGGSAVLLAGRAWATPEESV